jgi:hypothetical protein
MALVETEGDVDVEARRLGLGEVVRLSGGVGMKL